MLKIVSGQRKGVKNARHVGVPTRAKVARELKLFTYMRVNNVTHVTDCFKNVFKCTHWCDVCGTAGLTYAIKSCNAIGLIPNLLISITSFLGRENNFFRLIF